MKHLLGIEFAKVRNYRTFWVLSAVYLGIVLFSFSAIRSIQFPFLPSAQELFRFPAIWGYVTYVASIWNPLLGALVIILTCNEIKFRTLRQHIIDGQSRKEYIVGKFLFLIVISLAAALYTFLLGFFFGIVHSPASGVISGIDSIGIYFIQTIGYLSLAIAVALIMRTSALSIVVFVILFLFVKPISSGLIESDFLQLSPVHSIADLTPFPFFEEITELIDQQSTEEQHSMVISQAIRSLIALAWIFLFFLLSSVIVKKRDL